MIAIIDYGVGNVQAFANIYKRVAVPFTLASTPKDLDKADKLILPGVGAFDDTLSRFNKSGLREAVDALVLVNKLPVLGVCVGMQMMANNSEEGELPGLGWINASVERLDASMLTHRTRLPHMGWNNIQIVRDNNLLNDLDRQAHFYFLHSYHFRCHDLQNELAQSEYGMKFCCVVAHDNIFGVQFHPEKSHDVGIKLLFNFANM
jgi:glutamine amidotransferase